jgi:hypothetical protein
LVGCCRADHRFCCDANPRSSKNRQCSKLYGHWIEAVLDDGCLIRLEDGSLWQVDPIDTITSFIWLPVSNIIVCGNRLINEDDDETVHARRLR